jgi:hypothetical protein
LRFHECAFECVAQSFVVQTAEEVTIPARSRQYANGS